MSKKELIKELENKRGSRLISYITGDRQPFATRIAGDAVPLLGKLLDKIGKVEKISLFLYTSGGDMLAPIRIVKLIRNHCSKFEVIIPYKAHSAGTLICLGADTIVMGKLGELTPVDPTTGHPFNPQNPSNPQQRLEISVEDLDSYFRLAKEKAGVKEEQMLEVYKQLVEKVHPLSLGNAYRAYRMTRLLAERLLKLHMNPDTEEKKIQKIVKEVTSDIAIHAYPIDRDEASELGLSVEKPSDDQEKLIWQLYEEYAKIIKPNQPFHPNELLENKEMSEFKQPAAFLDSADVSLGFIFAGKVQKTIRNNQPVIDVGMESQSWAELK